MKVSSWMWGLIVGCVMVMPPAQAQWAVIDAASIEQLLVQIEYWKEQVAGMSQQLDQLQQTHAALTGGRGMESLLATSNAQRNYLPADWAEMRKVLDGAGGKYGGLSAAVAAAIDARKLLSDARLEGLGAAERDSLLKARQAAAGAAVTAQRAFTNAGQRFEALQGLVNAIGDAADAKAIADLEARIAAEQAMLGNEQAKLATLYQAAQAEQWAQAAELREAAIAGHGEFASRFHPALP
jgi:type IV secretion system protein VirB5